MELTDTRKEFRSFTLKPTEVFQTFHLSIPDFLKELSTDQIETVVPQNMVNRFWFARNEQRDMYLQINYLDVDFSGKTVEEVFQETTMYMDRVTPNFRRFGSGSKIFNGITISCMDYKSSAIDTDRYTIMFMFTVNDKCFSCSFSAPFANQTEWMQIFLLMIDTLTVP